MWQSPDGEWNNIRIPYDHQNRLKTTADVIVLADKGQIYLRTGDDSTDKGLTKYRMSLRESSWCIYDSESDDKDKWISIMCYIYFNPLCDNVGIHLWCDKIIPQKLIIRPKAQNTTISPPA